MGQNYWRIKMNIFILVGIIFICLGGAIDAIASKNYQGGIAAILLGVANFILFNHV